MAPISQDRETVDPGANQSLDLLPVYLPPESIGGVIALRDGRVWIGSIGSIWEYDNETWRQIVIGNNELFRLFAEGGQGVVYAATDTGVYEFKDGYFAAYHFVWQNRRPLVLSDSGEMSDCSFNRNYTVIGNCPGMSTEISPQHQFRAVLLEIQDDGTVIYINNHVIAKLQDQFWKSFLFEPFAIADATIDLDGRIWVSSITDGQLSLEADIFDAYQDRIHR